MALDSGLDGKVGLITGGARGIGFAIAKALVSERVKIAIADRDPDPAAFNELRQLDPTALFVEADLGKETEAVETVRRVSRELGTVDLVVNNAAGAWHEPVTRLTRESFQQTIDTNLAACLWICREAATMMTKRRSGSILIVGSTVRVCPAYREASYRISKAGLKMYMETLTIELAPFGIRVNMLTPGHHITRLTSGIPEEKQYLLRREIPLRRFGNPDGLGATAVLLLSDRLSPYTTGADVVVDGGLSLRPFPLYRDEEITAMNL